MKILDGKKLNYKIATFIKAEIDKLKKNKKPIPKLTIIQVGDNPASSSYIKNKMNFAEKVGIECDLLKFRDNIKQSNIINEIKKLNLNKRVNGIIVQLPLPVHLSKDDILNEIAEGKDVDGLGKNNLAKIISNDKEKIIPATTRGIINLLESNKISIEGRNILVIGRSVLVGKTTALTLINKNATVTVAHRKTKNLKNHFANNDIIITAAGKHGIINDSFNLEGKIIVDVGINYKNNKIIGDVKLSQISKQKLKALTPVPGGIGPMTVASLFLNVLDASNK